MTAVFRISINIFKSIPRSGFYLPWNICVLLLVLCLPYITFFDFEGGLIVSELFFTTLILSGAVNSFVFHLGAIRDLSTGQWDLLILRPIKSIHLMLGNLFGLMSFQIIVSLILLLVFFLESHFILHRQLEGSIWISWLMAILQIAMLSSLYSLIILWLNGFWASVAMVGAFLLGHLSAIIQNMLPDGLSYLSGLVFCLLPDLGISYPVKIKDNIPDILTSSVTWRAIYSITYSFLMIYAANLSLKSALRKK